MSFLVFPGQQSAVRLLQNSLERSRLAHAYLFSGGDLSELEALARELAKTLNCKRPPRRNRPGEALDCCDDCSSCCKIEESRHPDIHQLRPETKLRVITIDQIRGLMGEIHLKPSEARFKLAIISGADRLNVQAANAFLKTLEEPPARSILILLSTEPQRVAETILSRCLRLNLAGESGPRFNATQTSWLETFNDAASNRQNSLLDRYHLLGTVVSHLGQMKTEVERSLTEHSPLRRNDDVAPELREKWEGELKSAIEAEYRRRRGELFNVIQCWLRDIWLQTLSVSVDLLVLPQMREAAVVIAKRISPKEALNNLQEIGKIQQLLYTNVQEALAIEVGFLRLKL